MPHILIIGGGPAGYEAALAAAKLGAAVTIVEGDAIGGACVLYDCVPSKTFIATSEAMTAFRGAGRLGVHSVDTEQISVSAPVVHGRVKSLAKAQSEDIRIRLKEEGVEIIQGFARFAPDQPSRLTHQLDITRMDGASSSVAADVVLIATGATPRILPHAQPDGERILTWRQIYDLPDLPDDLVVVGSGVTGAEFASAYTEMGVPVTLVCSRDRLLPGVDVDSAALLEGVFVGRGMRIMKAARAATVRRSPSGVVVHMTDGRVVTGSHALMTVGLTPNTHDLGLSHVGVRLDENGYVQVDRVSRTSTRGIYAAGDCTGVMALASVAGMQGRIAIWHALGAAVTPLRLKTVSATVFTHPEIATVGIQQDAIESGAIPARSVMLPLPTNARAKMQGLKEGFVKLFCRPATGVVIGGVVSAPYASELILPITLAVQHQLTVADLGSTFAVYPSLSGSLTESARQLIADDDLD